MAEASRIFKILPCGALVMAYPRAVDDTSPIWCIEVWEGYDVETMPKPETYVGFKPQPDHALSIFIDEPSVEAIQDLFAMLLKLRKRAGANIR